MGTSRPRTVRTWTWKEPEAPSQPSLREYLTVCGDSNKELGLGLMYTSQSVCLRTSSALQHAHASPLPGQAREGMRQHSQPTPSSSLARGHSHNYLHHFLWTRKQRQKDALSPGSPPPGSQDGKLGWGFGVPTARATEPRAQG